MLTISALWKQKLSEPQGCDLLYVRQLIREMPNNIASYVQCTYWGFGGPGTLLHAGGNVRCPTASRNNLRFLKS